MAQFVPPASVAGQLLVWPNDALTEMLLMLRPPSPALDRRTCVGMRVVPTICGAKPIPGTLNDTAAGLRPVPLRLMVWGLSLALSKTCSTPLTGPGTVGWNAR